MTIEILLIALLLTNAVLFFVSMAFIFYVKRSNKEWQDFANLQFVGYEEMIEWLANNLSEFGDFGVGEHPNVIEFRRKD